MENRKFTLSISPHLNGNESVPATMLSVIIALIPALLWGFYIFKLPAIMVTIVCILGCISAEMFVQKLRKRNMWIIKDYSAVLTGILLAMVLPPAIPLWCALLGSWFAIIIGKSLFGGLGYNIFNPALLGRAFLQMSFPVLMTTWSSPVISGVEIVSSATPLAMGKFEKVFAGAKELFFGFHGGCIGETSAFLLLLGAAYLLIKGVIDLRIPLATLITIALFAVVFALIPGVEPGSIFYNWFAGGVIIGAFYMATDMITSPVTHKGKIIFGFGIGTVIMIIRVFGGLPEAVMFSILFMNGFVPIINRHTRPRILGTVTN
ncbi:MAG: RnfABCDGE type electron transport complex subunit D [bacterium]|nr:RnfABCDGE type electron transport complex subunit D [bacterium]